MECLTEAEAINRWGNQVCLFGADKRVGYTALWWNYKDAGGGLKRTQFRDEFLRQFPNVSVVNISGAFYYCGIEVKQTHPISLRELTEIVDRVFFQTQTVYR